ncbi:hypothetical protein [Wolbachia endosymbiont (group E) of Neria commutata]|uniref:hypothetical protein n=1 Tax=Wolbachia endosymbiont (group E) of Neria commutata TaxID=3066149 RepID=UPI003132AE44
MATFNRGFFASDFDNYQRIDTELHTLEDTVNKIGATVEKVSGTANEALNTADAALNKVDAFGIKLDMFEAAQGASDGAGIAGDTAALVGDVAEVAGDSDKIMAICIVASSLAVMATFGFVVFCFYQGIKHGKEEERNTSPANSNTPRGSLETLSTETKSLISNVRHK